MGAGSLGSLVGGLLARDHDVTLVGSEPHVEAIRNAGLSIGGVIQDRTHPDATSDPAGSVAELAIVTTKAYDTDRAVETLADCDVEAVWSLQNGLGNEAQLAAGLEVPVLAGTATYGADHTAPGTVTCTGLGEVAIGPRPGTPTPEADAALARELGDALVPAGPESAEEDSESSDGANGAADDEERPHRLQLVVDDAMPERLWRKLAVNVGINPTAALARVENGALAEGNVAETGRRAAREVAAVARAEGVALTDEDAVAELEAVIEATANNRSSMLQDVETGRQTEIDAIAGAVIDRAADHDVDVPTTRTLASLVREWERGRHRR